MLDVGLECRGCFMTLIDSGMGNEKWDRGVFNTALRRGRCGWIGLLHAFRQASR
jgi:hypothetical protein